MLDVRIFSFRLVLVTVLLLCLFGHLPGTIAYTRNDTLYSRNYIMQYDGTEDEAKEFGETLDLQFKRKVLKNFYEFTRKDTPAKSTTRHDFDVKKLRKENHKLRDLEQEELRFHVKKTITINDANWSDQWHLSSSQSPSMNLKTAWDSGYSGAGITIAVLDDGIDTSHSDLTYNASLSYDYVFGVSDPGHVYSNEGHGTSCAGLAAADNNTLCVIGTAFGAQLAIVRILDNYYGLTGSEEALALTHELQDVDIYSNSWGPTDDGMGFDTIPKVVKEALKTGVEDGRGGLGAIYTWASGNGGWDYDDCNADGYANSQYTIAIAAVSQTTSYTWYSEHCAAILAATYSGDDPNAMITTTGNNDTCINDFSGTSSATPVASGIIALTLEANNNLTWRDVQYLIVYNSISSGMDANASFYTNAAGFEVSPYFGFGLMDADAMVTAATTWTNVPSRMHCDGFSDTHFAADGYNLTAGASISSCPITYIEYTMVTVNMESTYFGDIELELESPDGTLTKLFRARWYDDYDEEFTWQFMSVHNWGEQPNGAWLLNVNDLYGTNRQDVYKWKVEVYGTVTDPLSGAPAAGDLGGYCYDTSDCNFADGGCLNWYYVCIDCYYNYHVIGDYCMRDGDLGGYCNDTIYCSDFTHELECSDDFVCEKVAEPDEASNLGLIIGAVVGGVVVMVITGVVIFVVVKVAMAGKATATVAPAGASGGAGAASNGAAPPSTVYNGYNNPGYSSWGNTAPPSSTTFAEPPPAYSNQPPPSYQDTFRQLPPLQGGNYKV